MELEQQKQRAEDMLLGLLAKVEGLEQEAARKHQEYTEFVTGCQAQVSLVEEWAVHVSGVVGSRLDEYARDVEELEGERASLLQSVSELEAASKQDRGRARSVCWRASLRRSGRSTEST